MKKVEISKLALERTVQALDEVEEAVLGTPPHHVRTGLRGGAEDGAAHPKCRPGSCPIPMYGVSLPDPFDL